MLIKSTTLQVEGTTLQLRCSSSSNLDPPRSNLGWHHASRCRSPGMMSQPGAPDLMQRKTKCSPSFPKEMAEPAQSYLHPGSGESAPDWKIPLPPMETWSNNVPDCAGTAWEPRLLLCLPGSSRGFPKLLNPPSSAMQPLGSARLRGRVLCTTYNQAGSETGVFGAATEWKYRTYHAKCSLHLSPQLGWR